MSQRKIQWAFGCAPPWLQEPKSQCPAWLGTSDTAAECGAVEPGRGPTGPGLVLLRQQQHKGHRQGAVVEAVHVGVIPLLQWGER